MSDSEIIWKQDGPRWVSGYVSRSKEFSFTILVPSALSAPPRETQYRLYNEHVVLIGKFDDLDSAKALAEELHNWRLTNEY